MKRQELKVLNCQLIFNWWVYKYKRRPSKIFQFSEKTTNQSNTPFWHYLLEKGFQILLPQRKCFRVTRVALVEGFDFHHFCEHRVQSIQKR